MEVWGTKIRREGIRVIFSAFAEIGKTIFRNVKAGQRIVFFAAQIVNLGSVALLQAK
jgi:hypothetical protein